jgi:hypothetical protein
MPWILMLAASSASGALGQAPAWIVGRGLNQFEWDFLNEAVLFWGCKDCPVAHGIFSPF